MEVKNDNHYIDQVLEGNTRAYMVLIDRYKDFMFHLALKVVRNEMEAEEVAMDAFMKAFKNLREFRREAKFSNWLYKICYYTAISRTRDKARHMKVIGQEEIMTQMTGSDITESMSGLLEEEKRKFVNLAMTNLPENTQIVLSLFYLKECSLKEIAEITGFTETNIKTLLHRGRSKLLEELSILLNEELKSII